jgi:hypothetical protein
MFVPEMNHGMVDSRRVTEAAVPNPVSYRRSSSCNVSKARLGGYSAIENDLSTSTG